MVTTTYPHAEVSPVDALWTLIQGQTKAVRAALTKRLVEQERAALAKESAESKKFTQKIRALENDSGTGGRGDGYLFHRKPKSAIINS